MVLLKLVIIATAFRAASSQQATALTTCQGAISKFSGISGECGSQAAYACSASACIANAASASDTMVADMITGFATCTGAYASFGSFFTAEALTQSFLDTFNACGLNSALTPPALTTCQGAFSKFSGISGEKGECGNETAYTCSASACIANAASASDTMVADMVTGFATCTGAYASYGSLFTAEVLTQSFLDTFNACGLTSALTPPKPCDSLAACYDEGPGTVGVSAACYQAIGGVISGLAPATQSACNDAQQATVSTVCQEAILSELAACPAPPPSPPPSPEMPGTSFVEAVVFEISVTAAGTVETFDKAGFETKMRSYLGCNAPLCQVAIAVTAGSVNVVATVTDTRSTAVAAAAKLTTDSTAVLSAALGVTVEAAPTVSAVTKTTLTIRPPTPPPAPKAVADAGAPDVESDSDSNSKGPIIGGVVGAVAVVATLVGVGVYCVMKKKNQPPASAGGDLESSELQAQGGVTLSAQNG